MAFAGKLGGLFLGIDLFDQPDVGAGNEDIFFAALDDDRLEGSFLGERFDGLSKSADGSRVENVRLCSWIIKCDPADAIGVNNVCHGFVHGESSKGGQMPQLSVAAFARTRHATVGRWKGRALANAATFSSQKCRILPSTGKFNSIHFPFRRAQSNLSFAELLIGKPGK